MMKLAVLSSLIASAAAFAPTQSNSAASTALAADFSNEIGAMTPLGFFDPLGFLSSGDQERFDDFRAKELKHGRVGECRNGAFQFLEGYSIRRLTSH